MDEKRKSQGRSVVCISKRLRITNTIIPNKSLLINFSFIDLLPPKKYFYLEAKFRIITNPFVLIAYIPLNITLFSNVVWLGLKHLNYVFMLTTDYSR